MAKEDADRGYLEPMLKGDPREVGVYNRVRYLVDKEALHEAWGCQLWTLHRLGKISQEEKRAGDLYLKKYMMYGAIQAVDPDVLDEDRKDKLYNTRARWRDLRDELNKNAHGRCIKDCLDALVVHDNHLTERGFRAARVGLTILIDFFGLRNKQRTKN
jgi:hypothetical protein